MINAKVDLVKVSKDVLEHLHEVLSDINAHVIPPQGQAAMAALASDAAVAVARLVNMLEATADDCFAMIEEPAKEGEEHKAQAPNTKAKHPQHTEGHR